MRLSKPVLTTCPWYLKPFFWHQKRKYGQALNPALVWANVPKLFITVSSLYGVLIRKKSPISPIMRLLITVRVSQINVCNFCIDLNSAMLLQQTNSEEKVDALVSWRNKNIFSPEEQAVLDYAEKITYSDQQVDEACFLTLKKYFNEKTIIELTALVAFQNLSSKFNSALDIDAQGFCKK